MSSVQVARLMSLLMPARKQLGLTSKLNTSAEGQEIMQKYTAIQQRSTRSSTGQLNIPISKRACQSHGGGKSRIRTATGQTKYSLTESSIHINSLVSDIRSWCATLKKTLLYSSLFLFISKVCCFLASRNMNGDLDKRKGDL